MVVVVVDFLGGRRLPIQFALFFNTTIPKMQKKKTFLYLQKKDWHSYCFMVHFYLIIVRGFLHRFKLRSVFVGVIIIAGSLASRVLGSVPDPVPDPIRYLLCHCLHCVGGSLDVVRIWS